MLNFFQSITIIIQTQMEILNQVICESFSPQDLAQCLLGGFKDGPVLLYRQSTILHYISHKVYILAVLHIGKEVQKHVLLIMYATVQYFQRDMYFHLVFDL